MGKTPTTNPQSTAQETSQATPQAFSFSGFITSRSQYAEQAKPSGKGSVNMKELLEESRAVEVCNISADLSELNADESGNAVGLQFIRVGKAGVPVPVQATRIELSLSQVQASATSVPGQKLSEVCGNHVFSCHVNVYGNTFDPSTGKVAEVDTRLVAGNVGVGVVLNQGDKLAGKEAVIVRFGGGTRTDPKTGKSTGYQFDDLYYPREGDVVTKGMTAEQIEDMAKNNHAVLENTLVNIVRKLLWVSKDKLETEHGQKVLTILDNLPKFAPRAKAPDANAKAQQGSSARNADIPETKIDMNV